MSRVGPPANPLAPESFRERFYGHQSTCRFRTGRRKRRVSGVGAGVCVNKVPGVRAGLIGDHFSAHQGVEDDHRNILCMGGRCVRTRRLTLSVPSLLNLSEQFPGGASAVRFWASFFPKRHRHECRWDLTQTRMSVPLGCPILGLFCRRRPRLAVSSFCQDGPGADLALFRRLARAATMPAKRIGRPKGETGLRFLR